jgi:hypothetical protein
MHCFENGTRLEELTPEQVGAAGVPSQGGGGRYLMAKCAAITAAGSACKGVPMPGESYCYVHHPDTKEERRKHGAKGGRRGGRGRPSPISTELARLQAIFERLADDVLEGKQDRSAAAVAIQALNGARGCLVGALKAREQEELARELEELKSYVQDREASRWRA